MIEPDDKPITEETFHAVDGRVVLAAVHRGKRLPHVKVSAVETVRGRITKGPVVWATTPTGARRLADALRRAAKISERGYATAKELGEIAGEDQT